MKRLTLLLLSLVLMVPAGARKKKAVVPEIPILAWFSIPPGEHATVENYRELREAGFTHSFAHIYSTDDALQALDLCERTGLKSIFMCDALHDDVEQTVRRVKDHPALGGYFLRDEPGDALVYGYSM